MKMVLQLESFLKSNQFFSHDLILKVNLCCAALCLQKNKFNLIINTIIVLCLHLITRFFLSHRTFNFFSFFYTFHKLLFNFVSVAIWIYYTWFLITEMFL